MNSEIMVFKAAAQGKVVTEILPFRFDPPKCDRSQSLRRTQALYRMQSTSDPLIAGQYMHDPNGEIEKWARQGAYEGYELYPCEVELLAGRIGLRNEGFTWWDTLPTIALECRLAAAATCAFRLLYTKNGVLIGEGFNNKPYLLAFWNRGGDFVGIEEPFSSLDERMQADVDRMNLDAYEEYCRLRGVAPSQKALA